MFSIRSLALAALVVSTMSSAAYAMLFVNSTNKAGLAVEKDTTGDIIFLMDINDNGKRVEYAFSPGTPFNRSTVSTRTGVPTAILLIYNGESEGMINSKNVSILDEANKRTRQRTNLSQRLRDLAQAGSLVDGEGKTYSFDEIKAVAIVFQVQDVTAFESSMTAGIFNIADLQAGTVKQLAGEIVGSVAETKADSL